MERGLRARIFGRASMLTSLIVGLMLSHASTFAATKRYLVQFKSAQTFQAVSQQLKTARLNQWRNSTASGLTFFNTNSQVAAAFDHIGVAVVEADDNLGFEAMKAHPAVASIEEEIIHPAPEPIATFAMKRSEQDFEAFAKRRRAKTMAMERPWGIDAVKAPAAWPTTKGDGARVMILDTGVDRDHPRLKSRFAEGKDFTYLDRPQDNGNGANALAADYDYFDTYGHGTHVAGTILADGKSKGLVGVAPEAKFYAGRVCGDFGCGSAAIIAGLDWAIEQKVDVINMSLGGAFITAAEKKAYQAVENANIVIAAASGNDGISRVGYPAALPTIIAVGAVDPELKRAEFSQYGEALDIVAPGVEVISSVPQGTGRASKVSIDEGKGLEEVKSMSMQGSKESMTPVESSMVYVGLGKPEEFAAADVKGKLALISRGEITFKDKVSNAIAHGAVGAIIFNNAKGLIRGGLTEDGSQMEIPAAMIEQTVGEKIRDMLVAGTAVNGSISMQATDYDSYQGTSMATPHVAGVVALVRAANKDLSAAQVREVITSTATPYEANNNEYGSGLVNAEAAVAKALAMKNATPNQIDLH